MPQGVSKIHEVKVAALNFQLWLVIFLITLKVKCHTVLYWKALNCGRYEPGGLSHGSTLGICQGILKSASLLHEQGFDDSQTCTTVFHFASQLKA